MSFSRHSSFAPISDETRERLAKELFSARVEKSETVSRSQLSHWASEINDAIFDLTDDNPQLFTDAVSRLEVMQHEMDDLLYSWHDSADHSNRDSGERKVDSASESVSEAPRR